MVCIVCRWLEAFPYKQTTATTVATLLLKRVVLTCAKPLFLSNNRGSPCLLVKIFRIFKEYFHSHKKSTILTTFIPLEKYNGPKVS